MKTILVPTDFNLKSIQILDMIVQNQPTEKFRVIFVHAFKLSDSINDMLMLGRRSRDYDNISEDFYEQLNAYRTKYPAQLKTIGIEYFYGSTVAAFKNFLENLEVELIAYPKGYHFQPINKFSINPKILTERSGCEVMEYDITEIHQQENLIESKIHEQTAKKINA